jgi:uncharacterized protein
MSTREPARATTIADPIDHVPVLLQLQAAPRAAYGDRLERAVLYGSRARGDANADSDWDVAVFLHGMSDWWAEAGCLAKITVEIMDATGELVHAMPHPAGSLADRTPLMHEIRREGRSL